MAGIVVKGAIDSQVRGSTLTSGTLCAAQVAEWLCAAMTQALRCATLPSMALAIGSVVEKEAAAAAEASGVGVSFHRCTCNCRTCRSRSAFGGGRCPSGCPGGTVTDTSGFDLPAVARVRPENHFPYLIALSIVVGSRTLVCTAVVVHLREGPGGAAS